MHKLKKKAMGDGKDDWYERGKVGDLSGIVRGKESTEEIEKIRSVATNKLFR